MYSEFRGQKHRDWNSPGVGVGAGALLVALGVHVTVVVVLVQHYQIQVNLLLSVPATQKKLVFVGLHQNGTEARAWLPVLRLQCVRPPV